MDAETATVLRGRAKAALTRIINFIDKNDQTFDKNDIRNKLEKLELTYTEFDKADAALPIESSEMEEFETKYYETKAKLQNILENLSVRTYVYNDNSDVFENVSNMKSSNFKLPKINIERFSGDYKNWPSFKDLYVSLVHDNMCLSNIQKFQYLRGLLLSEPANIIKHIPITETAYNEAWEKLLARYDKKKQIIFSLIKTFMEQPSFNDTNSQLTQHSRHFRRSKLTESLNSNSMLNLHINGTNIDNQLKQFWELEEIPNVKDKLLTSEEQFVETHFQNTYACNSDGRFVVKLPFYKSNSELGDSKPAAISRLLAMERKFKNNPDFEKTIQRIHERIRIARSHELSKFQIPYFQRSEFLPHHAVIKPSSPTTKLRVVFDASCKTTNGTSLNSLLEKWNSNSTEFRAQFSEHSSHDTRVEFSKDSNESSKVLGLFWNSSNDTFGFQPSLELTPPLTKRRILSESSKIFDPLGLLSPCTVFMKIFYQKLWLTKTDWDSPIPQQLTEDWLRFQKAFNAINYLTVPRWVILTADNIVELHGFADASSLAYAAAIYCRQKHNGKIKVQLLVSKTKVAPVKQVSIPRLSFLSWLSGHPRQWKTFVANRTSEIIEVLPTKHWRHVPSKENPADIASRGIDPKCLPDCKLWWQGPPWLRLETSSWPKAESSCDEASDEHSISELLIKEQHIAHLHAGPTLLAHVLRQSHWIVGSRKLINKCIRKCLKCNKFKTSTTTPQLMGNLPKHRVTLERPFFSCGIDYAGPVLIKCNKGRGTKSTKGYIALFLHYVVLVLVGAPRHIYSDNGTNFVGARRKLDEIRKLWLSLPTNEAISYYLSKSSIDWHFIPPSSPHFGGIWESGIRSVKFHLKRVLGETILTFEELTTLLTQIEGLLNSRPLSYVNDSDIECISTLTPSHFLTGDVLLSVPEELPSSSNHRDRWELLQNIKRGFWKKWSSEFISSLQPRKKWQDAQPNMKEDDIVLIKEEGPPGTWPMARVLQVHPGNDGPVRVATVKTQDSVFKRPVHKLHNFPYIRTSSDIGGSMFPTLLT
ncbi:integrase catalytic domain-containing protein [Trichonephila clavipes]|nr:integrase catalytic domain-containing protein [Trichonephila clavipes]